MREVSYITDKPEYHAAESVLMYRYPEVVPWQVGTDDIVVFNVWDKDRLAIIKVMMLGLTDAQRTTLARLAPDWYGTPEDLINAAKELA